jgi:hypothetical protein
VLFKISDPATDLAFFVIPARWENHVHGMMRHRLDRVIFVGTGRLQDDSGENLGDRDSKIDDVAS